MLSQVAQQTIWKFKFLHEESTFTSRQHNEHTPESDISEADNQFVECGTAHLKSDMALPNIHGVKWFYQKATELKEQRQNF